MDATENVERIRAVALFDASGGIKMIKNVRLEAEMAWAYSCRTVENVAQEFELDINQLLAWMEFDAVFRYLENGKKEKPRLPILEETENGI
jgi:uncharacterized protein YebE (UPF0316 family)